MSYLPNLQLLNMLSEVDGTLVDGRMYFSSKASFQLFYDQVKQQTEEEQADFMQHRFYAKNFYSLVPLVNVQTQELQIKRHAEKMYATKMLPNTYVAHSDEIVADEETLDDLDDLEDVFGRISLPHS